MKLMINNMNGFLVSLFCICVFGLSACGSSLPKAQITIRVVDEDGNPVVGARVGAAGVPGGGPDSSVDNGFTSDEGRVTLTFRSMGSVEMSATKEGYYMTRGMPFQFTGKPDRFDDAYRRGHWESWNPEVEIELKSIRSPIPMYVNHVNLGIPELNNAIGFDFILGDWVSPYGKGSVSDLVFFARLDQRDEKDFDYELHVSFSNPGDGLIPVDGLRPGVGSVLRSLHEAPEYGYQPEWFQWTRRRAGESTKSNMNLDRFYYTRVRTELDQEGKVKSAFYGKIYGDFLYFTYYLNPTPNSRNLEYGGKTNLISGERASRSP